MCKIFEDSKTNDTANASKSKTCDNKRRGNYEWGTRKKDRPPWVPDHSYDFCDKNANTKDPKGRGDRISRRKDKQDKKGSGKNFGTSEVSKLKDTVAAQKKLLSIKKSKTRAIDREAASNTTFDDDEDLDVQAAAH